MCRLRQPPAHDQPDNADRLTRLGVTRTLYRKRYSSERAATELGQLLGDPSYARRASAISQTVRQEDGVRTACDALEALLSDAQK